MIDIFEEQAAANKTTEKKAREKIVKPVRKEAFFWLLCAPLFFVVVYILLYLYFPLYIEKIGGTMVGVSVAMQMLVHWMEMNPLKKLEVLALRTTIIAGIVALFGTIFWTFGDLIGDLIAILRTVLES